MAEKKGKDYVIGVDGGGTKTVAALADLNGKILSIGKSGSSNPRNIGIEMAVENITQAIKKILAGKQKRRISSTFIGLPSIEEEYKVKKPQIKKEILKKKEISEVFKGKIKISSDQIVAFRSGTDEKTGMLIIAGTGCVAHGWRGQKDYKAGGWGWLADEGSAFWAGQRVFQVVFKNLDNRGRATLLTKLAFQKLKVKTEENLLLKIYSKNPAEIISSLSILIDKASERGDKVAQKILIEAGKELALAASTVIKKLNFQNKNFPLVLVGSMFKSKIILEILKKEIKKVAPQAKFVQPKVEPVIGAVKLAIESIKT